MSYEVAQTPGAGQCRIVQAGNRYWLPERTGPVGSRWGHPPTAEKLKQRVPTDQ